MIRRRLFNPVEKDHLAITNHKIPLRLNVWKLTIIKSYSRRVGKDFMTANTFKIALRDYGRLRKLHNVLRRRIVNADVGFHINAVLKYGLGFAIFTLNAAPICNQHGMCNDILYKISSQPCGLPDICKFVTNKAHVRSRAKFVKIPAKQSWQKCIHI